MENKDLLIQDLGCRIYTDTQILVISDSSDHGFLEGEVNSILMPYHIEAFKTGTIEIMPYLRSISSITEEEKKELSKKYVWDIQCGQIQIRYHSQGCWDDDTECPTEEYIILFNWLNAHHFDFRNLIKKGLALEAPENMYNNN